MFLSTDGTFKSYLKRVKSDKASFKWLQNTASRYYTVDFKKHVFYYSHSEAQTDMMRPIKFEELKEVEPSRPKKGGRSECSFTVKAQDLTIELFAPSEDLALQWVELLRLAKDMVSASKDTRRGHHPSGGERGSPENEAKHREILRHMPCDIRRAVAEQEPLWTKMSWGERLRRVQHYAIEHGLSLAPRADMDDQSTTTGGTSMATPQYDAASPYVRPAPAVAEDPRDPMCLFSFGGQDASRPQSADVQERCRAALVKIPCSIRGTVASQHPDWVNLSWAERYSLVQRHCMRNGIECEDVLGAHY